METFKQRLTAAREAALVKQRKEVHSACQYTTRRAAEEGRSTAKLPLRHPREKQWVVEWCLENQINVGIAESDTEQAAVFSGW